MRIGLISAVLMIILLNSACLGGTPEQSLTVSDPWVRASGMVEMSGESGMEAGADMHDQAGGLPVNTAGYLLVENVGDQPDRLLRVESDIAEAVELHISEIEDDVMKMRQVEFIEVPPNSQVELKPGGYHIMFIGLNKSLDMGDRVEMRLIFEIYGELAVLAEVRAP